MNDLFLFPNAMKRDPAIEVWMRDRPDVLSKITHRWFDELRKCGDDVRELLHDGHPTACVGEAAFAYVDAFKEHVNVGFYRGAELSDANGILQGTGKRMRHVKISPDTAIDDAALTKLIRDAYRDMKRRLKGK